MKSTYLAGAGLIATGLFAGAVAFAPQTNAISPAEIGYEGSNVASVVTDGVYNLTLTGDATQDLIIGNGQTVVLDLNGHTLTNYSEGWGRTIQIEQGGSLTIKDTVGSGKVAHKAGSQYGVITNMGTLNIESGQFETAENFDVLRNEGTATISNGVFTSTGTAELIDNTCNASTCGTLNITGGIFESNAWNLVSFNEDTDYWTAPENAKAVATISGGVWTANNDKQTMIIIDGSEVAISGGIFNYAPTALAENHTAYKQSDNYIVAESVKISSKTDDAIASIIEKVAAGETVTGVDSETAENIVNAAIAGKTISAAPVKTSKTADAVASAEADKIADAADGLTLVDYYDVDYFIFATDENGTDTIGGATELEEATELRFTASTALLSVPSGYTRHYKVVRVHNGTATVLDAELDGDEIVTSSDKFSTYVIAYYDVAVTAATTESESATESTTESSTTENPNTSTGTVLLIALVAIGAVSLFGLIKGLKWTA